MNERKAQRMKLKDQLSSMRRQNCALSHKLHRQQEEIERLQAWLGYYRRRVAND